MSTKRDYAKPSFSLYVNSWNFIFSKLESFGHFKKWINIPRNKSLQLFIILKIEISKTKHIWI